MRFNHQAFPEEFKGETEPSVVRMSMTNNNLIQARQFNYTSYQCDEDSELLNFTETSLETMIQEIVNHELHKSSMLCDYYNVNCRCLDADGITGCIYRKESDDCTYCSCTKTAEILREQLVRAEIARKVLENAKCETD